jgi:site-specific DNA-methyltransferase (adenine-specific)
MKLTSKSKEKKLENKLIDNTKRHSILVGNCLKRLDEIKDESCKLVFADPPYNMGKKFGNNHDSWESSEKYKEWSISWIEKCISKLTPDGSIMIMGHPRFSAYLVPTLDNKLSYANQIIYYYTDGMPEKKNFERRYEMILYYRKNPNKFTFNVDEVRSPLVRYEKTSNPKGKNPNDVWQINRVRWNSYERVSLENGKIAHAAQKPVRLIRRILLAVTNKDDLILDPFLGTGTTSVAAKELKRKSIGIELNPDYAKISLNRINNAKELERPIPYEKR